MEGLTLCFGNLLLTLPVTYKKLSASPSFLPDFQGQHFRDGFIRSATFFPQSVRGNSRIEIRDSPRPALRGLHRKGDEDMTFRRVRLAGALFVFGVSVPCWGQANPETKGVSKHKAEAPAPTRAQGEKVHEAVERIKKDLSRIESQYGEKRTPQSTAKIQSDFTLLNNNLEALTLYFMSTPIKVGGGSMTFSSVAPFSTDGSGQDCIQIADPGTAPLTVQSETWTVGGTGWSLAESNSTSLSTGDILTFYGRDKDGVHEGPGNNDGYVTITVGTCNSLPALLIGRHGNAHFYDERPGGEPGLDGIGYMRRFKHNGNCDGGNSDKDKCERMSTIYFSNPHDSPLPCTGGDCYVTIQQEIPLLPIPPIP